MSGIGNRGHVLAEYFPGRAIAAADSNQPALVGLPNDELQTILGHTPFLLAHCSAEFRYLFVSDAYARMFGRLPEEVAGKPIVEIMGEEGFSNVLPHAERTLQGELVEFETTTHIKPSGVERSFRAVYVPVRDSRGDIKSFVASITDVSDQRKAEAMIAADLTALTLLQKVGSECVRDGSSGDECLPNFVDAAIAIAGSDKGTLQKLDPDTGLVTLAAQRGFDEPFLKFLESVNHGVVACACATAMRAGKQNIVEDVTSFNGQLCQKFLLDAGVHAVISTPLTSTKGALLGMLSTHFRRPHQPSERELHYIDLLARQAGDYLERRRAEDFAQTLVHEIQHRCKNLLTIVQSIVHRTLSGDLTLVQAREKLESRLQALARSDQRLTKSNWSDLDLTEIVRTELKTFSDRVKIAGPNIALNAQQGQNLALVLHELATNAAKYGALSDRRGTVRVFWTITGSAEGHVLKFNWEESGGPLVVAPTRRGFGSTLISVSFPNVRLDYAPQGFRCEFDVRVGANSAHSR